MATLDNPIVQYRLDSKVKAPSKEIGGCHGSQTIWQNRIIVSNSEFCWAEDAPVEIVNTAINRSIRYFDTAWAYSNGQAETRFGKVAKHRRSEMWIATKTLDTTRDGARRQLETSLSRLQTDYINEWRFHNLFNYERLDAFTDKGGALEVAIKALEEGLVRYISVSGHTKPKILIDALNLILSIAHLSLCPHWIISFSVLQRNF